LGAEVRPQVGGKGARRRLFCLVVAGVYEAQLEGGGQGCLVVLRVAGYQDVRTGLGSLRDRVSAAASHHRDTSDQSGARANDAEGVRTEQDRDSVGERA